MNSPRLPVGIILVGVGPWGLDWAKKIVPQVPLAELAAIVCRSLEKADLVAQEVGCRPSLIYPSLQAAIDATGAKSVLIATQTASHAQLAGQAIDAGCHVLVEKPFAATISEASRLVRSARERNLVLMVSQNYRYFPTVRRAAELVSRQQLGPLHRISIDFRRHYAKTEGSRGSWITQQYHPLLFDMGIHHFDLIRMVSGLEATNVACLPTTPTSGGFRYPSTASASIALDGGVAVSWRGSWQNSGDATTYSGQWRLECEYGDIVFSSRGDRDLSLDHEYLAVHADGKVAPEAIDISASFGRAAALKAFCEAVNGTSLDPYLPLGADNLKSLILTHAVIEAAQCGRTIAVPSGD